MNSTVQQLEKRGIRISAIGTLSMVILAVAFSLLTGSQAILLDGFYAFINLAMVLISAYVTKLA